MKASRFFLNTGIILLVAGLILTGISFAMGASWQDTLSLIERDDISQYYRRNDNGELDSDATIWDEAVTNELFYEFPGQNILSMEIDIANSDVVITEGNEFSVRTDNIKKDDFSCRVSRTGKLTVGNAGNGFSLFNILSRRSFIIRGYVEITVPAGWSFENLELAASTGTLYSDVAMQAEKAVLSTETGTVSVKNLTSGNTKLKTSSGKIIAEGMLTGKTDINCQSGTVEASFTAPKDMYSYSVDSGMGEVSVNGTVYSGSTKASSGTAKKDNIKMTCGSGYISVNFQ